VVGVDCFFNTRFTVSRLFRRPLSWLCVSTVIKLGDAAAFAASKGGLAIEELSGVEGEWHLQACVVWCVNK
jgi:hypothetical protein